jgi:hypothetical protein
VSVQLGWISMISGLMRSDVAGTQSLSSSGILSTVSD